MTPIKSKKYPEPKPVSAEQSKVAEPAASYTISPSTATSANKLMTMRRRIAGLKAPDEVWEFAQKHHLIPHLETAVRLAKESFHDIRTMDLAFDPDPEEPTLDGVILRLKVGGPMAEWEKQYKVYALKFIEEIPNDFRSKICLFYY
jgi:hypothetical protein